MAYLDEKIIPERLALNKQSNHNIYDDHVYAGVDIWHFIPTKLFDGKVVVMLPETFEDMPELLAEVKYPSVQRPQVIKMNDTGAVNFCFNLFESPIEKDQIEKACADFQSVLQRMQPSLVQLEKGTEELLETAISWFQFYSFSMDDQIYNQMFVTSIHGKLMNGTMNCPRSLQQDWRPIMQQVILSIEDHSNNEQTEEEQK